MATNQDLTDKTVKGFVWLFAGKGVQTLMQLIVMIILSRLLTPAEFGVVAAAMAVVGIVDVISHVGIGPAVTQRARLTDSHVRTGFWSALALGSLFLIAAPAYVPLVAAYFRMSELQPILYLIVWIFPLRNLGLVAESLMVRELRFGRMAQIEVISYVLGYGAIGILLAVAKLGSWALAIASVSQVALRSVLLLLYQPHSKRFELDRAALRELLTFGGGFTLARIANNVALQGDNLVIGRWLGPDALGAYTRAYQLMVTPAALFGQVLDKVLFPAMAKFQDDQQRLASSYRRGVALIALLAMPASAVMVLLAPEIVGFLLGPQWIGVVGPFRILAIGTLFRTSYKISDSIARSTGAVYRRAWRQAVYALLVVGGAWTGQHWGVNGVAVGVSVALVGNFLLMAHLSLKLTALKWNQFLLAHADGLRLTLFVMALVAPASALMRRFGAPDVLLLGACGVLVLGLALAVVRHSKALLSDDGRWFIHTLLRYVPARMKAWAGGQ